MSILSLLLVSFSLSQPDLQLPKIVDPANPPFPSVPSPQQRPVQQQPNQPLMPIAPQQVPLDAQLPMPQLGPDLPGFAPLNARDKLQPDPEPPPPPAFVPPAPVARHTSLWPEIWGFGGFAGTYGNRMAPNGVPYNPLFDMQGQINFGILPDKQLYLFFDMDFWAQKAGAAVTNPTQGSFDFSKREWDFNIGLAWNYWGPFELRTFGYAFNNLNRGNSLVSPFGYNDGVGIENRYYFSNADKYDVGKLSFLSIGYMPSNSLTGQDGLMFHPGLTARAYLTCDIPMIRSYLYFDGQYFADNSLAARLLKYDAGVAVRPCESLQNLEFRIGGAGVYDVEFHYDRSIGYLAVRLQF